MHVDAPQEGRRKFKTCRRDNTPGDAHSITFSCFRRQQFLRRKPACLWLADAINNASAKYDFAVWAFVIMPEHVHLLLCPRQNEYDISRILSGIKQSVSKRAIHHVRTTRGTIPASMLDVQPSGRRVARFWQRGGGYDRNLWSPKHIWESVDYIHANPVRRRLCDADVDWAWSSARMFCGDHDRPIRLDLGMLPDDPRRLNAP